MKKSCDVAMLVLLGLLMAREAHGTPAVCMAPERGIEVVRTGTATWQICSDSDVGPWRAVVTGEFQPADARRVGNGSIRLRELWWTDGDGVEWPLMLCGNCDAIQSVKLPGTSTYAWTGGGYGMEGDHTVVLTLLDGQVADLQIGAPERGQLFQVSHSIAGYAPGAALSVGSARDAVQLRIVALTFEASGIRQRVDAQVLDQHDLGLIYHPRLEAVSACDGGLIDGYETSLAASWLAMSCDHGPTNLYTYPIAQPWVELTSTLAPVRLRVTIVEDGWRTGHELPGTDQHRSSPWRLIWTLADPTIKLKAYGIEVNGGVQPLRLERGQVIRLEHLIQVR